jgi:thiamine-monophosphate kinase
MSAMPVLDEFAIIERYFARRLEDADVLCGIGDDAAVVSVHEPIVVAVDTLVAGVHFPDDLPARDVGYRVLAVNLSDIAAMGARPRWCTLALTLPAGDAAWIEQFAAGLFELAEAHHVALIGGDLARGPLTCSLQIIGTAAGGRVLTRAGARAGDDVWVTGTLGDAAAGLALWRAPRGSAADALRARLRRPVPRVAAGAALLGLASAAIDVSDGLVADLGHLCERSGCAADIDVERLPMSEELRSAFGAEQAYRYALAGGDDYELCFAAARDAAAAIDAALAACGTPAARIGRLSAGRGVRVARGGKAFELPAGGYTHF